ncbi:T9SS type A sorting domain-containing protein, partial [bacterium]|nr:T9SS type A sorting domain-containing protein [bacterium]
VAGDFAYLAEREAGMLVVDISTPSKPVIVGSIDTSYSRRLAVHGDYVYVADGSAGVKVVPSQCSASVGVPLPPYHEEAGPQAVLGLARPNPFENTTALSFTLPLSSRTTVDVFDVSGRLVRTLVEGRFLDGEHEVQWDGRDRAGLRVGGGTFFLRLTADQVTQTRKVVFLGGR